MRKRYLMGEILAIGILIAILFALPVAIVNYHVRNWNEHSSGRIVGIVARNDNIVGRPGLWMIQNGPLWNYRDKSLPNELEINHGEEITLMLTAADAVHEFSLDGYGLAETIYPGEVTARTFLADKLGEFKFECTSYCGVGHDRMVGKLIVVPKEKQTALAN